MIEIRTYIKNADSFVPIEVFDDAIVDPQYVEGAIELTVNGIPLITLEMWDYVDQLWEYLVDAALKVVQGCEASTFFPDQPIEVTMRPAWAGSGIDLEVSRRAERRRTSTAIREFIEAFYVAGRVFFERMMTLVPANDAGDRGALEKLELLRSLLR